MLKGEIVGHILRQGGWRSRCSTAILAVADYGRDGPATCRAGLTTHISAFGVVPRGLVVGLAGGIEARIETIFRQLEAVLDEKWGVGVIHQVVFGDTVVLNGVADEPAQKGNIRTSPDWQVEVGDGGCPRESRVDYDHLGIAVALGFNRPLEAARMVLGWIPALDQHHVGVLDVDPAVSHRPASKCRSQT